MTDKIVSAYDKTQSAVTSETANRNTNIYVDQTASPQSSASTSAATNSRSSSAHSQSHHAANAAEPNHSAASTFQADSSTMGYEDGLNYTVNASTGELKPGDKRTVNYLAHRMIWDQQEKIDLDDRAISKDGTMEVQDEFEISQSGINNK